MLLEICLFVVSVIERAILKLLANLDWFISPCTSASFCFVYSDALLLGAYRFRIVVFLVNWSSSIYELTLLVPGSILCFKSTLSDINTVTPAFFQLALTWYIFLHSYTFNQFVSFYLRLVSWRQRIVESYFFMQSNNLCLLVGV